MYRFVLTFFNYNITSSDFKSLDECNSVFDHTHLKLNPCGGRIETYINGIGWVVYEH